MIVVYIGLGSNLSDPVNQVRDAFAKLKLIENSQVCAASSLYFSRPMGPQDQPDYINAVIALQTSLSAIELLDKLQAIENEAGRVRKDNRWGPRVLDLDIILYGNNVIKSERLTIPHYGMKCREFVLIPLAEIASDLVLPDGDSVNILSNSIKTNELKVYDRSLTL